MSVHLHPQEWSNEMNRLLGSGEINRNNYMTDLANAVVYVRDSATKIVELERELAEAKETIEVQHRLMVSGERRGNEKAKAER